MYRASSLARNTAGPARSLASPTRPIGMFSPGRPGLTVHPAVVDRSRHQRIDPNSVRGKIQGHGPGQGLHAAFRGIIGCVPAMRAGRAAARHVDDDPRALPRHDPRRLNPAEKYAPEVDRKDPVPPCRVPVKKVAHGVDEGRVVDEHINGPKVLHRCREHARDLRGVRDVCGRRDGRAATRCKRGGHRLRARHVDVVHHHVCAISSKSLRDRAPDAAGRSRHDHAFSRDLPVRRRHEFTGAPARRKSRDLNDPGGHAPRRPTAREGSSTSRSRSCTRSRLPTRAAGTTVTSRTSHAPLAFHVSGRPNTSHLRGACANVSYPARAAPWSCRRFMTPVPHSPTDRAATR